MRLNVGMYNTWQPIPGYVGIYEVSNGGAVRSCGRWVNSGPRPGRRFIPPRLLKPELTKFGYHRIALQKERVILRIPVHQLVLLAFVGPRPIDREVAHWNGIRTDNRLHN